MDMKKEKEKTEWVSWEVVKRELEQRPDWAQAEADNELEFKILDAIVDARVRQKLSQRDLAQKIGIAQSALARFESGNVNPTLAFLQKVAKGLGLVLTVRRA